MSATLAFNGLSEHQVLAVSEKKIGNKKNPFITQLAFTCSKSATETPEKDAKYVQS